MSYYKDTVENINSVIAEQEKYYVYKVNKEVFKIIKLCAEIVEEHNHAKFNFDKVKQFVPHIAELNKLYACWQLIELFDKELMKDEV